MLPALLPAIMSSKPVVLPARLAALQAESEALIAAAGIVLRHSAELGGYLVASRSIAPGALVMLLPPNRIQSASEVSEWNAVIQVRSGPPEERLYSSSLLPSDLDNFLAHSCDPCCRLSVDAELTVRLHALRAVAPEEPLSIDYEVLEEDMVTQGVTFHCCCGAAACRGEIMGSIQRAARKVVAR